MQGDALATDRLIGFDFVPRTRIVFGPGVINWLGSLAAELGGTRALLVTDRGLAEAGHEKHSVESLQSAGLKVTVFDEVHQNPTTEDVERCAALARQASVDIIVGLGGGSSMDCAKGCNFLVSNGGRIEDYWGVGKAKKPMLPAIGVPTTAGTGSEAQSFALIADAKTHMKMACGDRKAAFAVAVLDPNLTLTQPAFVKCATGIDAISHAVETYVTQKRNPISQLFSRAAWQQLAQNFAAVCEEPDDLKAREHMKVEIHARAAMQLGAHWAGAAIENSMLGAAHSLANPLSAHFDVTHGVAVGIMLPHVIRFNADRVARLYGDLAADAGLCDADDPEAPSRLADFVGKCLKDAKLPTTLTACDVDESLIPTMAVEAVKQWTAQFNPRSVDTACMEELYQCAMHEG